MMRKLTLALLLTASSVGLLLPSSAMAQDAALDRTVLPIAQPQVPPVTELDARNATPPPPFAVKAPSMAPNVLIILLDDMGFGQPSAFGGPIHMPTLEQLAGQGLKYNTFETTALCSPTRTTLLTGRNHHMNNMGAVAEVATAFAGNTGVRPNAIAPVAEILRLNGYGTAAFGKYHEAPPWEISTAGPFDRWPTHSGFDKFYGFMGGETNQWAPLIYDGTAKVEHPLVPTYNFMTDMTDQAISWVSSVKTLAPDKPFFIYFAPGAVHAPHHVPKEWIDKYKGVFDQGWDKLREQTLARQIKLGVVPAGTKLAPKPDFIKDWNALTPQEQKLFAHQMEVYAGFGEYADHEVGRLIQALRDRGQLDNTLVFYMAGDNGASAEGGANGVFNENTYFNAVPEPLEVQLQHMDELGGPMTYNHYASGWAVAGDTPFTWTKQVAGSYGGTRNGMVVSWPNGIKAKGQVRSQWSHVVDVAPTILDAAGLPEPKSVNGTVQIPMQGVSMRYSFDDASAKDRHLTQYFEILGNRAIYNDGWLAGTVHKAPWEPKPRAALAADKWELYNTRADFSLANDLAASNPAKLKDMQALFMKVAAENHVLPIDDRSLERFNAALAGRPDLMGKRTSLVVYPGMIGMMENAFINVKNKSFSVEATVANPKGDASGVIVAQAGRFGGWSLWLKGGRPTFTYNWLGIEHYDIASDQPIPTGNATIRFEFAYDGGKPGSGGTGTIFVNGSKIAQGRIKRTQPYLFSADEGADVGMDEGTPVSEDYQVPAMFTGTIEQVTIDVKPIAAADQPKVDQNNAAGAAKEADFD
ncbi:arylsulfatase [Mesorhizobium sp. NFR06]|uniref:arylsulfatase n=1 Tax=Mesorhizobium sp. NFR06 TaxID=1566290 RepID=UPI0008E53933|nr:arylsulfatase [Mesorhizobium sp. NFR06]SFO85952.1 arylsulfatase [Mesorhizobium sp. NFR06]